MNEQLKTYIGVLTSHDVKEVNNNLVKIFNDYCIGNENIRKFHFIFTGGTFNRVILGTDRNRGIEPINDDAKYILLHECGVTKLHGYEEGGVTILSYLITHRLCSIIWPFFSPKEHHWRRPENLAQWRLCDQWNVKRLTNSGSVRRWLENEASIDANRNKQPCPPTLTLREDAAIGKTTYIFEQNPSDHYYEIRGVKEGDNKEIQPINDLKEYMKEQQIKLKRPTIRFDQMTLALIAHDEMKQRMVSFAIDHEWELRKFRTILATGTTGREVAAVTSKTLNDKIH